MENKINYLKKIDLISEASFSASRSSGPGGQNVNKVNTRIELRFNINSSLLLNEREKAVLRKTLKSKLNSDCDLIICSQTERSQFKNKEKAIERFYSLIGKALVPRKKRIPTKPTLGSTIKRLETKKTRSKKKELRRKDYNNKS